MQLCIWYIYKHCIQTKKKQRLKPGPCGKILSINNFTIKLPCKIISDQSIMTSLKAIPFTKLLAINNFNKVIAETFL